MMKRTQMKATPTPSLEERIRDLRGEIDAVIDAHVQRVARDSPGVPCGVIRNLLTARAPNCPCSQYLALPSAD